MKLISGRHISTACLSRVELVLAAELEVVLVDAPVLQVGAERHHAHLAEGGTLARSLNVRSNRIIIWELYKLSTVSFESLSEVNRSSSTTWSRPVR